jgi:methyltransferase (TIGR00027 family)
MRKGQASTTSTLVAFMRALADAGVTQLHGFDDAVTQAVLPLPLRLVVKGLRPLPRPVLHAAWRMTAGGLDLIPLRTRAIDDAWHEARATGIHQLVILGAGLDMRAWRLADLQDVAVFEVDHPATQAEKQRRVRNLRPHAQVTFVPVDFTRDDLGLRLREAGLRTDQPALWIWEGVVMYLPREAVAATLATLVSLSAPGSRLAMTYVTPEFHTQRALAGVLRVAAALGEPFLGLLTTAEVTTLLTDAGLTLRSDTDPVQWAALYSDRPPLALRVVRERLAVAAI